MTKRQIIEKLKELAGAYADANENGYCTEEYPDYEGNNAREIAGIIVDFYRGEVVKKNNNLRENISLKNCPFCGGDGELVDDDISSDSEGYYPGQNRKVVRCKRCKANGSHVNVMFFRQWSSCSVNDYRNNPALRARHEAEFSEYITDRQLHAVKLWNNRERDKK